jgi:CRP-like cAMP-binding protein
VIPTLECILDRSLAEKIIERSVEVITQDGVLFRQGQRRDCLYFVKWGEVALTIKAGDKEIRIRAGKGSLLGLPAVYANQPYTMTAKAAWDAEIFKLGADAFSDLMDTEPRMHEIVLQVLAGEVRAIRQAFSQLI